MKPSLKEVRCLTPFQVTNFPPCLCPVFSSSLHLPLSSSLCVIFLSLCVCISVSVSVSPSPSSLLFLFCAESASSWRCLRPLIRAAWGTRGLMTANHSVMPQPQQHPGPEGEGALPGFTGTQQPQGDGGSGLEGECWGSAHPQH